jgi:hypothetical protein
MASLGLQGIALLIEEILAAISAAGPAGVDWYLKLESLFKLGPDGRAKVAAAIKAGLAADTDTISVIAAGKKQMGAPGIGAVKGLRHYPISSLQFSKIFLT